MDKTYGTLACTETIERAIDKLINQLNENEFGEMNEATLQHHLALNLYLDRLEVQKPNKKMILEKKLRRSKGNFAKGKSKTAYVDIYFELDGKTSCAIELKYFLKVNHREPNNRYDAYADIKNLELYLEEHIDIGFFILITDHPHYFDNNFKKHSEKTADFCLRDGHQYIAGTELEYRTSTPYGGKIILENDYKLSWKNLDREWRILLITVK